MCGIAGIWNFDGAPVAAATIDRFNDSLSHRGPDGRGVWFSDDSSVALGHRRLAILDLSEDGKQPMSYADGRYWITYNGEIYNFIEIRAELEAKGYLFQSTSDTEVILAAYIEFGEEMLFRFNGMWAFAIYDCRERVLFIARDRFGIKPFHYRLTKGQFAFASELKAFKCLDGYEAGIDNDCAAVFLRNGFAIEGSIRTMLAGVNRLQGGYCGVLRNGILTTKRWWNTLDHLIEPPESFERQAEEFRELFYDAVKIRMRSDVPVGSCLSGGFDSSAIVCAMAEIGKNSHELRQAENWQQTFVATFPGAFNDERAEAEEVIKFANVKGNFFPIADKDALDEIDRVLHDFDDVYIGMPTAPWLIYRELRRAKVVVSIDGHGADELMGAYMQADSLLFHDAPSLLFSPADNLDLLKQYETALERFAGFGSLRFKSPAMALFDNHPSIRPIRKIVTQLQKVGTLLSGHTSYIRKRTTNMADFQLVAESDKLPAQWGNINRTLYRMFHSDTLPTILRNFDRLSMAHGVEIRMPFMDWRLVRFLFSLPDSSKIGQSENKRVAREAMKGRMPESIRSARHKIGFNSPMPEWLNGPLDSWATDLAGSKDLQGHELIDGAEFLKVVTKHTEEKSWTWQNSGAVWQVLNYLWFEKEFLKK